MYKEKTENVEVYFICYKKEEMELIETYYDETLDIHCWYFNAYLAYKHWQNNFKDLNNIGEIARMLLTVAASRYILYQIENGGYKNKLEHKKLKKELQQIEPILQSIIEENEILLKL